MAILEASSDSAEERPAPCTDRFAAPQIQRTRRLEVPAQSFISCLGALLEQATTTIISYSVLLLHYVSDTQRFRTESALRAVLGNTKSEQQQQGSVGHNTRVAVVLATKQAKHKLVPTRKKTKDPAGSRPPKTTVQFIQFLRVRMVSARSTFVQRAGTNHPITHSTNQSISQSVINSKPASQSRNQSIN